MGGQDPDSVRSYENTTLFFVSCFQYVFVALAFSKGRPFRQPTHTNGLFLASLLLASGFLLLLLLCPLPALDRLFQLACIPYEWRLVLLVLAFSNLVLSLCLENFVCDCDILWQRLCYGRQREDYPRQAAFPQLELGQAAPVLSCCRQAVPRAKYQRLAQQLLFDPDWPPQPKTSTRARVPPAETHA